MGLALGTLCGTPANKRFFPAFKYSVVKTTSPDTSALLVSLLLKDSLSQRVTKFIGVFERLMWNIQEQAIIRLFWTSQENAREQLIMSVHLALKWVNFLHFVSKFDSLQNVHLNIDIR